MKNLTPEQYHICRLGGTEPAGSGTLLHQQGSGSYICVCCGHTLFESNSKFDSGTGWPSFWETAAPTAIKQIEDTSYGMLRIEVRCTACDAHLGHVFQDGPKPTGLRYCINSLSLEFVAKK